MTKKDLLLKKKFEISKYEISTCNRRSKKWAQIVVNGIPSNYQICKDTGRVRYMTSKILLHEYKHDRKYRSVNLKIDDTDYRLLVHRILACIYLPIPDKYIKDGYKQKNLTVNHIDGNPENCSLDNLEWCTPQENTEHTFRTGLAATSTGEQSHLAKITEETAKKICECISKGKLILI